MNDADAALVNVGASWTVRVKLWVAVPAALVAVNVIGKVPPVPAVGVPLSTPVMGLKVTPLGSAPVSFSVGAGNPVAVTVKLADCPTVNVVDEPLVIVGLCWTVNVKVWVAEPVLLVAVNCRV
jgi:hypothetical protein